MSPIACGCQKVAAGTKYLVTKPDGSSIVVNTIGEASAIIKRLGGGTFRAQTP